MVSGVVRSFRPCRPPHMSAGAKVDGVPVEADQLGEAQARLDCDQQQGVIAAAEPRRPIGRGEDCPDLGARQEVHLSLVVALARYGEHALDQRAARWLLERPNRKKERMAARRRLRVLALAPRFVSRSIRNAP